MRRRSVGSAARLSQGTGHAHDHLRVLMNEPTQLEETAMKTPLASSRGWGPPWLALIGLLAFACSGSPAASQPGPSPTAAGAPSFGGTGTPAGPGAAPTVATTPTEPAATATATAPGSTPPDLGVEPAPEDASATVQLGGQTYLLEARAVPDPAVPLCSLGDGFVSVGLTSADQQSLLVVFASHAGVRVGGSDFYFQVAIPSEQRGERWAPTETVPFSVTGSTATWNGMMEERLGTGGAEQVAISIDCGG